MHSRPLIIAYFNQISNSFIVIIVNMRDWPTWASMQTDQGLMTCVKSIHLAIKSFYEMKLFISKCHRIEHLFPLQPDILYVSRSLVDIIPHARVSFSFFLCLFEFKHYLFYIDCEASFQLILITLDVCFLGT